MQLSAIFFCLTVLAVFETLGPAVTRDVLQKLQQGMASDAIARCEREAREVRQI